MRTRNLVRTGAGARAAVLAAALVLGTTACTEEPDSGGVGEPETVTETGPEADSEPGSETETDAGSDAETELDADTEAGS